MHEKKSELSRPTPTLEISVRLSDAVNTILMTLPLLSRVCSANSTSQIVFSIV